MPTSRTIRNVQRAKVNEGPKQYTWSIKTGVKLNLFVVDVPLASPSAQLWRRQSSQVAWRLRRSVRRAQPRINNASNMPGLIDGAATNKAPIGAASANMKKLDDDHETFAGEHLIRMPEKSPDRLYSPTKWSCTWASAAASSTRKEHDTKGAGHGTAHTRVAVLTC